MRRWFIALLFLIIFSEYPRASELSEILSWMDNTYNPHSNISGAYGHGHTGWYARKNSRFDEVLVYGSTETLTYDGCQMTLRTDDPAADALSEMQTRTTRSFNLRDINPQSIKMSTFTHLGGFRCDMFPEAECDHAEIVFFTHNEAPLIDEDRDTVYLKLQGSDHELRDRIKAKEAYFEVDGVEYARRLAKAFRHAVELCGGKPEPF